MANLDTFSEQIVKYVRSEMSDEAILDLVRNKLLDEGGEVAAAPTPTKKASPAPSRGRKKKKKKTATRRKTTTKKAAKKAAKKKRGRKKGGRRSGGDRDKEMELVEKTVKSSKGMSASEISKKTKIPQSRVSSHVRTLKANKRIYQGGDRRFARYAGDAKTAKQASEHARKTAAGPRRR